MSEGFLSRWARRKAEVARADRPSPQEAAPSNLEAAPPAEAAAEPTPDEITPEELAALPAPEELTAEHDVAAFMRRGVPAALRQAALRRMWALDPAIRDYVDPAREYAYDWNVAGGVPGAGDLPPGMDVEAAASRLLEGRDPLAPSSSGPAERDPVAPPSSLAQGSEPAAPSGDAGGDRNGQGERSAAVPDDASALDQASLALPEGCGTGAALDEMLTYGQGTEPLRVEASDPKSETPSRRSRRHGGAAPV